MALVQKHIMIFFPASASASRADGAVQPIPRIQTYISINTNYCREPGIINSCIALSYRRHVSAQQLSPHPDPINPCSNRNSHSQTSPLHDHIVIASRTTPPARAYNTHARDVTLAHHPKARIHYQTRSATDNNTHDTPRHAGPARGAFSPPPPPARPATQAARLSARHGAVHAPLDRPKPHARAGANGRFD